MYYNNIMATIGTGIRGVGRAIQSVRTSEFF